MNGRQGSRERRMKTKQFLMTIQTSHETVSLASRGEGWLPRKTVIQERICSSAKLAVIKKIIIEKSRQLQALFVERRRWWSLFFFPSDCPSPLTSSSPHSFPWSGCEKPLFIITAHRLTRDIRFLYSKWLTKSSVTLKWLILFKRLLVLHSTSDDSIWLFNVLRVGVFCLLTWYSFPEWAGHSR